VFGRRPTRLAPLPRAFHSAAHSTSLEQLGKVPGVADGETHHRAMPRRCRL
jgi:hypothetical protein